MSAVYEGGDHAAALVSIRAMVDSCWVTIADGSKDLDRERLAGLLRAAFDDMVTDAEAASVGYVAGIDVAALVQGLNVKIRREAFMGRSDWPSLNTVASPAALGAAVREALAELKRLAAAVTAHYANTADEMFALIGDYVQQNVLGNIPQGIDRIENTRAYEYTWVTDKLEESAPSPASVLVTMDQNDAIALTMPTPPSGRNITRFRLYRGNTTNTEGDAYQRVPCPTDTDGWPIADLTIIDEALPEELLEECPTTTWDEPPADGKFICSLGNGISVMATGNEVRPCAEAYVYYAFPIALRKTSPFPIVGMAGKDRLLVVGTTGAPMILTGTSPAALNQTEHVSGQACVAARSMVPMPQGVVYASPDGLCLANAGGVQVITDQDGFNLFSREDWQAIAPANIFAAECEKSYVFHVGTPGSGFCYSLDLTIGKLTTIDATGSTFYRDALTDTLYMTSGTANLALFSGTGRRTAIWKSKRIVLPAVRNFSWLQVNSDLTADVTVRVTHFVTKPDGTVITTTTVHVASDLRAFKIPPGRSNEWELQVESTARVTGVSLAGTTEELRAV